MTKINFLSLIKEHSQNKKYADWYVRLIEKCNYSHSGYTEKHHVVPSCLFPEHTKNRTNIIRLTAREHFVAHLLLHKAFPHNRKLAFAFFAMTKQKSSNQQRDYTVHSRIYEIARNAVRPLLVELGTFSKGYVVAKNTINGSICTVTKKEFDDSPHLIGPMKGKRVVFTEAHKQALKKPKVHRPLKSEDHKRKIAESHKGKQHTSETKEKLRNHFAKTWIVLTPDNKEIIVTNLNKFCKDNSISNLYKTMRNPSRSAKGYKLKSCLNSK